MRCRVRNRDTGKWEGGDADDFEALHRIWRGKEDFAEGGAVVLLRPSGEGGDEPGENLWARYGRVARAGGHEEERGAVILRVREEQSQDWCAHEQVHVRFWEESPGHQANARWRALRKKIRALSSDGGGWFAGARSKEGTSGVGSWREAVGEESVRMVLSHMLGAPVNWHLKGRFRTVSTDGGGWYASTRPARGEAGIGSWKAIVREESVRVALCRMLGAAGAGASIEVKPSAIGRGKDRRTADLREHVSETLGGFG